MDNYERAIAFWTEVQEHYPHPRVEAWIEALKTRKVDWYREAGLALVAIGKHSHNKSGYFVQYWYDGSVIHIKNLVKKYDLHLQW